MGISFGYMKKENQQFKKNYETEFQKTGIQIKKPHKDTSAQFDKLQMLIKNKKGEAV